MKGKDEGKRGNSEKNTGKIGKLERKKSGWKESNRN